MCSQLVDSLLIWSLQNRGATNQVIRRGSDWRLIGRRWPAARGLVLSLLKSREKVQLGKLDSTLSNVPVDHTNKRKVRSPSQEIQSSWPKFFPECCGNSPSCRPVLDHNQQIVYSNFSLKLLKVTMTLLIASLPLRH